jgi:hypothetical protein
MAHGKGRKVTNFKYKAKVRYRRKRGHRQAFTRLAVREISIGGVRRPAPEPAPAAEEAPAAEAPAPRRRARVQAEAALATDEPIVQPEDVASSGEAAALDATPPTPRRRRRAADSEPSEGQD